MRSQRSGASAERVDAGKEARASAAEAGRRLTPPSPDQALTFDQTEAYDAERKYLEDVLNRRLNFYMVFASLLIVGLFGSDAVTRELRILGALFGAAVSALISVSVWRTHRLVAYIVERINSTRRHPYAEARAWIELQEPSVGRGNANAAFARVPILVGWLFVFIAVLTVLEAVT